MLLCEDNNYMVRWDEVSSAGMVSKSLSVVEISFCVCYFFNERIIPVLSCRHHHCSKLCHVLSSIYKSGAAGRFQ